MKDDKESSKEGLEGLLHAAHVAALKGAITQVFISGLAATDVEAHDAEMRVTFKVLNNFYEVGFKALPHTTLRKGEVN